MKIKKPKTIIETVTGSITSTPRRLVTRTGKPMTAATLEVNSNKRSNYPLRIIGFDLLALELLTLQRGHQLTVKGAYTWNNGYQLVIREIIHQ